MIATNDIDGVEQRTAPIEMTPAAFREAGYRLIDQIAGWLQAMPDGPVTHDESPAAVRLALQSGRPLPESGLASRELLDEAADLVFRHSLFNGHPRFFGYICSRRQSIQTSVHGGCHRSPPRSKHRPCDGLRS
jgi:hypothetical protein